MDELPEIREQIARHTEEQRTMWLQQLCRRYSAWMIVSSVFAVRCGIHDGAITVQRLELLEL
jgi:hypothetical protein